MPGTIGTICGQGFPASGQTVMGLVKGQGGTNITQASLSAISYTVTRINADESETETGSGTVTVSSAVYDTAQTSDPRYTLSGGYNFAFTVPASCFPAAGRGLRHRITVLFDPASGENFAQDWLLTLL